MNVETLEALVQPNSWMKLHKWMEQTFVTGTMGKSDAPQSSLPRSSSSSSSWGRQDDMEQPLPECPRASPPAFSREAATEVALQHKGISMAYRDNQSVEQASQLDDEGFWRQIAGRMKEILGHGSMWTANKAKYAWENGGSEEELASWAWHRSI